MANGIRCSCHVEEFLGGLCSCQPEVQKDYAADGREGELSWKAGAVGLGFYLLMGG